LIDVGNRVIDSIDTISRNLLDGSQSNGNLQSTLCCITTVVLRVPSNQQERLRGKVEMQVAGQGKCSLDRKINP